MVGFNFAPQGWALCNGQLLPISQYSALFSLLGTQFGGNGVSTFALPNLQGRTAIDQGQSPGTSQYVMGQVGGNENATLLYNNMPIHTHSANANNTQGANADPTGAFWAEANDGNRSPTFYPSYATSANATMAPTAIGTAGGNLPFPILPPYLCVNFVIALTGIYPSRG
jgi:microcystin-dependent protein